MVINGQRLTPAQIGTFKSLTGLPVLEPGRYWLDPNTGELGHEGAPMPCMNVFQNLVQQTGLSGGSQASLSQRRQLFNSADLSGIWGAY